MVWPAFVPRDAGAFRAMRCIAFLAGLTFYYLFSSPTPDHLGAAEYTIAALLAAAMWPSLNLAHMPLWLLFFGGALVPALVGVLNGQIPGDIVRDGAAFAFLFLVLVYRRVSVDIGDWLLWAVAGGGALFAARTVVSYAPYLMAGSNGALGTPPDLLYLANSPEVMFAALWFLGQGLQAICADRIRPLAAFYLGLSALCALSMGLMMQRAGIAIFSGAGLVMTFYFARQSPRSLVRLLLFWTLLGVLFWPYAHALVSALLWKTHVVGLNSRYEEWMTVLRLVGASPSTLLFGEGWGGRLANPAVGGLSVLFTHSFFSALLLKTGVIGCLLGLAGMALVFAKLVVVARHNLLLGFALFWPLLISVTIYASYKSLGFGLLLLIISVYPNQKLEKNTAPVA